MTGIPCHMAPHDPGRVIGHDGEDVAHDSWRIPFPEEEIVERGKTDGDVIALAVSS